MPPLDDSSADQPSPSTRPYLIRALHDWCTDNGFTPYLAVYVDSSVRVPMEYVKNHEIVLNVGFEATSGLRLGNETIEFKARFGGSARDIMVPVDHVIAIYARENGQGMAFPVPSVAGTGAEGDEAASPTAAVPDAAADTSAPAGLRLATPSAAEPEGDGDDTPPPAPGPGATPLRPTLKRVK